MKIAFLEDDIAFAQDIVNTLGTAGHLVQHFVAIGSTARSLLPAQSQMVLRTAHVQIAILSTAANALSAAAAQRTTAPTFFRFFHFKRIVSSYRYCRALQLVYVNDGFRTYYSTMEATNRDAWCLCTCDLWVM